MTTNAGLNLKQSQQGRDSTPDLLTIMTNKVTIKFKVAAGKFETESGC